MFTENDITFLQDFVNALSPIQTALKNISGQICLVQMQLLVSFFWRHTPLCNAIKKSVKERIQERRNNDIVGLLKYLHDSKLRYEPDETGFFCMPTVTTLRSFCTLQKLFFYVYFNKKQSNDRITEEEQQTPEAPSSSENKPKNTNVWKIA